MLPHLEVIHKLFDLHLGLVHPSNILEADAFPRLAVHDSELGHFQLIL